MEFPNFKFDFKNNSAIRKHFDTMTLSQISPQKLSCLTEYKSLNSEGLTYLEFFDMLIQDDRILKKSDGKIREPILYLEHKNRYVKGLLSSITLNIYLFLASLFQAELNVDMAYHIKKTMGLYGYYSVDMDDKFQFRK